MATQTKLIRGKIARILSTREVALNIGEQNGVALGMLFDIVSEAGLDIRDPDTDRELGSVELPKVRIKVTRVYDELSVASTYRTKRVNIGGRNAGLSIHSLFRPPSGRLITRLSSGTSLLNALAKTWTNVVVMS